MLPVVETHQIFVYEYMISKILSILQKRKFSPFLLLSGFKAFQKLGRLSLENIKYNTFSNPRFTRHVKSNSCQISRLKINSFNKQLRFIKASKDTMLSTFQTV